MISWLKNSKLYYKISIRFFLFSAFTTLYFSVFQIDEIVKFYCHDSSGIYASINCGNDFVGFVLSGLTFPYVFFQLFWFGLLALGALLKGVMFNPFASEFWEALGYHIGFVLSVFAFITITVGAVRSIKFLCKKLKKEKNDK